MRDQFTNVARRVWDSIPNDIREDIINNVWCPHCESTTTMLDYKGMVDRGDLILKGYCEVCDNKIVRMIEGY